MSVTVEKIQTPADDASVNASKVAYTAENGLSPSVSSIVVNVYLSSMDLSITAKDAQSVKNIQQALKEQGMEAQTEHDAKTHRLNVRNVDAVTGVTTLVTALGKMSGKPGGISREVADQIMEMELAAALTPPSEWGLTKVGMKQTSNKFADKVRPASYVKAEINYELSPVAYLEEDGTLGSERFNGPLESQRFTRMGLRDAAVSKPVLEALSQAGIKADIIHIDGQQITHVNVQAPADKVSNALKEKGLMLPSIDTEIQAIAVKARLASAEEQARLRQANARAGQQ